MKKKIYKVITAVSFPELPCYQTAYPTNLKYCKLKKKHYLYKYSESSEKEKKREEF